MTSKRASFTNELVSLLTVAERLVHEVDAKAMVLLVDVSYDFAAIRLMLPQQRIVVAADDDEILAQAREERLDAVKLSQEPEARRAQLSQALLEAIADELLQSGDKVVALYPGFEQHEIDTVSVINLSEQLTRLSARDLQRLETQVPLETLRTVVELAVEIAREGREGKKVGTLFTVGAHRKVLSMSHEQVHDPFRGYSAKERQIRDSRVRESIKEIAQMDGAFIISADGIVYSAGRHLDAPATGITVTKGLGARHWAAAAISKSTKAVAIAVSESSGTVRIYQDGKVVLRIEPMARAMTWQTPEAEADLSGTD